MTSKETSILTSEMIKSWDTIDLSKIKGIKIDKYSTGEVGDEVSLIIVPIIASLGMNISKMSGKGLGFTGRTLDKLESVPGFQIELTQREFIDQVNKIGIAIIYQTGNLVPADKKIYSLHVLLIQYHLLPH